MLQTVTQELPLACEAHDSPLVPEAASSSSFDAFFVTSLKITQRVKKLQIGVYIWTFLNQYHPLAGWEVNAAEQRIYHRDKTQRQSIKYYSTWRTLDYSPCNAFP